jgi:hypothetical protein
MSDSYITTRDGSTSYVGPDATNLLRAIMLSQGIKMWSKYKMIPTRGVTITYMLSQATAYTGKTYKSKETEQAIADIDTWVSAMKSAIPVNNK